MIPSIVVFIRRNTVSVLWKLAKLLLNFGRRASWKKHLAFLVLLVILVVYYGYIRERQHGYILHLLPVLKENFQTYCNYPVNAKGVEGKLPNAGADFKLDTVQVLIRHGDRSPIMNLKGIEKRDLDCSMTPHKNSLKSLFNGYKRALNHIKCKTLSPKAVLHNLSSRQSVCGYHGQLTQKGFQQLIEIGRYLRKAYSDLEVTSSKNIYCRSTNVDRTAQTVAALLYGIVDEHIITNGQIYINVTTDTYFREDDHGFLKSCAAMTKPMWESKMSAEYHAGSKAMEPFMQEMAALLMMPRNTLPSVPFIADFALVHFCHGLDFPCTKQGCFSEPMVFKMLSYADWSFYHKYSQLGDTLALPVLTQIGSRMLARSQSASPITLAIYGGHESSIIPVLISLGTYNRRWIPYASRLVFELWTKSTDSTDSLNYIRVLFNGESVTHKLTFCQGSVIHESELCPLNVFLAWLGGGRFEDAHKRYERLCNR